MAQWFKPTEMFSEECIKYAFDNFHIPSLAVYENAAIANGLEVIHLSKHNSKFKFRDVHELVEFHMAHFGRKQDFGREHFDVEAMKKRYGEGDFTITSTLITVIAQKS